MTLLVVILHWSTFVERVERAYYQHMTISFPMWGNYVEFNSYAISSDARQDMRDIQNKTQPGQKILVWISMPMHLDFSRNEIYSLMSISLLNPWLDMPFNGNANDMVHYLKGQGIRYVMWEESGGDLENTYRRWLTSPFVAYRRTAERGYVFKTHVRIHNEWGEFSLQCGRHCVVRPSTNQGLAGCSWSNRFAHFFHP